MKAKKAVKKAPAKKPVKKAAAAGNMVSVAVDKTNRSKVVLTFPKKFKGYIKKKVSAKDLMGVLGGGADVIGQCTDLKRMEVRGILRSNLCLGFGPNSEYGPDNDSGLPW